jgi:hypothetical protein
VQFAAVIQAPQEKAKMYRASVRALLAASLLVSFAAAFPGSADARQASPFQSRKPVNRELDCVRKQIQVCHWEGDVHVCVWVDGPDCEEF